MIKSVKNDAGYINEITKYLDEYLINKTENYFTYIEDDFEEDSFYISFVATIKALDEIVGTIHIDEGTIKDISILNKSLYSERVLDGINQFIDRVIDLPLEDYEIECIKTQLTCSEDFEFKPYISCEETYIFKKGDLVRFEISDIGVRFEYEHNLYTTPIRPSTIYKYFK